MRVTSRRLVSPGHLAELETPSGSEFEFSGSDDDVVISNPTVSVTKGHGANYWKDKKVKRQIRRGKSGHNEATYTQTVLEVKR